jgi:hypothetical protein
VQSKRSDDVTRVVFGAGVAVLWLGLAGCSGPPTVQLATPNGPQVLFAPQPAMPQEGAIPPPANLMPSAPPPGQPVNRNGTFTGTANLMSSYGNMCQETVPVVGFRVSGNRVRFGRFHGTIDSNDGLQMVSNQQWIVGQFEGATFHGQVTFWTREGPGCTYVLSLQRTSA